MIQPVQTDELFLRDVALAREEEDAFHLWWLGQSGFLLQWQEHHLILDPYLSDSLAQKYLGTNKPHNRMTERVVDPRDLDFIDVATSSHNHTDHLDPETLRPLFIANPAMKLIIPEANRQFVADYLGIHPQLPLGVEDGVTEEVSDFRITGVAAAHEELEQDEEGRHKYLGYVIQFGPWTVYHSGDTIWYEGLEEKLKEYAIDVALLPINGRDPARGVAGNMDGPEAAKLAKAIGARLAIPCHYEMFEFNTASPDAFSATAEEIDQPVRVLKAAERWSSGELA